MEDDQVSPWETSTTRHSPDFLFPLTIQLSSERSFNNDQLGMLQEPQAAQSTRVQDHSDTFGGFNGKPGINHNTIGRSILPIWHCRPHFGGDAEGWPESINDVVGGGVEQGFVHWLQLWRLVIVQTIMTYRKNILHTERERHTDLEQDNT